MSYQSSDVTQTFLTQHPDVELIELLVCDLNGILRGKRIHRNLLKKVMNQGFYLPGSIMSLDATGTTVETAGLGANDGDRDLLCLPIAETLSTVPWAAQGKLAQVLCMMHEENREPFFADPRQILIRLLKQFNQLGFDASFAVELEFYLIDNARNAEGNIQPPCFPSSERRMTSCQVYSVDDIEDHDFFIQAVLDAARQQGVPADTVIAEYAPAQFEVNLRHQANILTAVDHAVLLKRIITNVAKSQNMAATFMAKPYIAESGNGMHFHLSLSKKHQNQFHSNNREQNPLLQQAVGGILDMADATQALLMPNINSYRRLAKGSYAPTSKTWGIDNRTTGVRIPASDSESTRIEHRFAGADANPYLAAAVVVAGVMEGVQQATVPPAPRTGNVYEQEADYLADNMRDALRNFDHSEKIKHYFGEAFVTLYSKCKWHDLELFEQQVTPMEYELLLPYL